MDLNELAVWAFETAQSRGYYLRGSDIEAFYNFFNKAKEELDEAEIEYSESNFHVSSNSFGKPEGLPVEVADLIITCLSYAHYMSWDIEALVKNKLAYNQTRDD